MTFIILLIVGFILGVIVRGFEPRECPAEIYGYDCKQYKGRPCDHSEVAVLEAKLVMARYRAKEELAKEHGMKVDHITGAFYKPDEMTRTEKDGVISFRSK